MSSKKTNSSPIPSEGGSSTAVMDQPSPVGTELLCHLMEMADRYLYTGDRHAAEEIYFELVEEHVETEQAQQAERRLIEIAQGDELAGRRHSARAIYERLVKDEEQDED